MEEMEIVKNGEDLDYFNIYLLTRKMQSLSSSKKKLAMCLK
jgi:hypothetical protein